MRREWIEMAARRIQNVNQRFYIWILPKHRHPFRGENLICGAGVLNVGAKMGRKLRLEQPVRLAEDANTV